MYVNDLLSIIRMSYKDSCYLSFYLLHSRCDMLTWIWICLKKPPEIDRTVIFYKSNAPKSSS